MEISKLAAIVNGIVDGDGSVDVKDMSSFDSAEPGDMVFAIDDAWLASAENSKASCILTTVGMRKSSKPLIRVKDPKYAFLVLYNVLNKYKMRVAFTHPSAAIAPSVKMGENVWIGPNVSIDENAVLDNEVVIESNSVIKKNCRIGYRSRIHPNVTLYAKTIVGKNVTIHSGAVIGSDGFGYVKEKGEIFKFPQLGKVIIEDEVEIGANTTIDRGSLSDTVIGAGTKIDNLCQIAHNVKIGKNVLIAALTGISGSTVIKDNVTMGGQVGIADNLTIHEDVRIAAKSGIIGDIEKGETICIPGRLIFQTKRQMAALSWLAKNFQAVSKLIKK